MDYRAFGFTQEDNYCRIDVDRAAATVTVRAFDWKGAPIKVGKGKERELVSTLQLTQW